MNTTIVPLISGFVGAIIGAAGAVLTVLIKEKYQSRRERCRLAVDLATRDYEFTMEMSKRLTGKVKVYPLTSYLLYHRMLLQKLEKPDLSPEELKEVFREHDRIDKIIEESQRQGRSQNKALQETSNSAPSAESEAHEG